MIHHLTEDVDSGEDCGEKITEYLKGYVPDVSLVERGGWELNYLLPLNQSRPLVLKELFRGIDGVQSELGIQYYGMTSCSMEEVGVVCLVIRFNVKYFPYFH